MKWAKNILFLSACSLLVQSLPIKFLENQPHGINSSPSPARDFQRKSTNKYQAPKKPLEYALDAGQGPEPLRNTVGLRLFPKLFEGGTNWLVNLNRSQARAGDASGPSGGDRPSAQGGTSKAKATEMTVSVPRFITDSRGNWVYDKWGATFGQVDFDTRFKEFYRGQPPTPKPRAVNKLKYNYYPNQKPEALSTVCNLRSTLYNFPGVYAWLRQRLPRSNTYDWGKKPHYVWMDLREQLYKDGNSLQCHNTNMTDWNKYIHCALMRNMRMDYLIPQYPLHQIGLIEYNAVNDWSGN